MIELKIDPEFEALCPPLTEEEFRLLKESILSEGVVLMPIIIWDDLIIDGHNRYKIIRSQPEIKFTTYKKDFENRYFAKAWICCNQLGRRNLTPQQRKYLIGQRYEAEKKGHGAVEGFRGNQHINLLSDRICHLADSQNTRERIASETNTSKGYVENASLYCKGVDAAEKVCPGIKNELLSGAIKASEITVASLARTPAEDRRKKVEELRKPRDKPKREPHKKMDQKNKSFTENRQKKAEEAGLIEQIYGEMLSPHEAVSNDSLIGTLDGIAKALINSCNAMFEDFPQLTENDDIWKQVLSVLQPAKDYITQLERKNANENN